jgi:hypothetical protein
MLIITGHTYIQPAEVVLCVADQKTLAIATRLRASNIAKAWKEWEPSASQRRSSSDELLGETIRKGAQ